LVFKFSALFLLLSYLGLELSVFADVDKFGPSILFDGKSLENWQKTDYAGGGEVRLDGNGSVVMEFGIALTGMHWVGESLPLVNYELIWEAKKESGTDFFASATFPFKQNHATLILGGWGGALVGISSIDGFDASENTTSTAHYFKINQWYKCRLRVTETHFKFWIDDEILIDFETKGRKISMRTGEIELSTPLGFSTYDTTGLIRKVTLIRLKES
jgi:hypothetical protein